MMVGMMLPSAAPTILLFAALERKRTPPRPYGRVALFVTGYFVVWSAFSIAAALLQTALSAAGQVSMEMVLTSGLLGGAMFILAGLYEFSPLKGRCLSHCRSPLEWIAHHQRPGSFGALRMGIEHGLFCLGCCWMLMLLALRRRRDEFALGRRDRGRRAGGETAAGRTYRSAAGRRRAVVFGLYVAGTSL